MTAKILIVDDEASIRSLLTAALRASGFETDEACDTQGALAAMTNDRPHLILLDWMLPGVSGIDFAQRLKRDPHYREIPIIMLTARSEEDSKVYGLECGADDYVTKPFSTRELVSRIKANIRRQQTHALEQPLVQGELVLDPASQRVSVAQQVVMLGPTEYKLLAFFMSHPEKVYSREQLLNRVWGGNVYIEDRTVDVHILRLRKALKPVGYDDLLETVRGTGYRFAKRE